MNITKARRRFLLCGCSHGQLASRSALNALLKFKADFRPHFTAHLGDFCDTTAWRSGARDSKDEGASVSDDLLTGLGFLEKLEPQAVFIGNHEARIYKHAEHPNAIVREAARSTLSELRKAITQELKAKFVETYEVTKSWLEMGDTMIGHGFMFNENAIRDHAEFHGRNVIIAHLHRQGMERARASRGATGYCVGYLGNSEKFTYADTHKAKAKWTQGFAYGEFSESYTSVNLFTIQCQKRTFEAV